MFEKSDEEQALSMTETDSAGNVNLELNLWNDIQIDF